MRNLTLMAAAMLALTACGDKDDDSGDAGISGSGIDWCTDYFNALEGCYAEAGITLPAGYDFDSLCTPYDGINDQFVYDLMYCYVDAIEAGDCSTEEGLTAISTSTASCAGG